MNQVNKFKIFNDPIYGFISIPNSLIYDLIQHPYFQRLRRISQMGLSYLVYPGANHTRFHHALGCMHIMQKAIEVLRFKAISISAEEEKALYITILLHDIGHGPFSHAMEHSIVENGNHELISLQFMRKLNEEFNGELDLAIKIFTGNYHRNFMLQLVSSQLDMDRMDYLKRDSFYSGVAEGSINSDRLIQMMNVVDNNLVIEEKGIYSVENFLIARRLMYWQVYFHKTSLLAELILAKILKRAKELSQKGEQLNCSEALNYFLKNKIEVEKFDDLILDNFSKLDDYDIISALKEWQNHNDFILSTLSKMIINRDLLKIIMSDEKFTQLQIEEHVKKFSELQNISLNDSNYFVFKGKIKNQAYNKNTQQIQILKKNKQVVDIIFASDQLILKALTKNISKYFICFPKVLTEN
ncbi:MAG: HD domain-containing protein [Flavobacterium sp.]|nr:HD domain-containing protein [Flavobacterium sp.]